MNVSNSITLKKMKKFKLLFSLMIAINCCEMALPQSSKNTDLMLSYVEKMFSVKGMNFQSEFLKKEVFSMDTVNTIGEVTFSKKDNKIAYLRIVEPKSKKELILFQDSVWAIEHGSETQFYLGGRNAVKQNGLFHYFPVGSILIDTSQIGENTPWDFLSSNNQIYTVRVRVTDLPVGVTSVRYDISVSELSLMPAKVIEEVGFEGIGNLYQETRINNCRIFDSLIRPPVFLGLYRRDYSTFEKINSPQEEPKSNIDLFHDSLEYKDIKGNTVFLPDTGLLFLDLWYVGCMPCMKATPIVESIAEEYKDYIHFYSVNELDSDLASIKRFAQKMNVTIPILLSNNRYIANHLGNGGYPMFLLLDASTGKVLWTTSGYSEDLAARLRQGIDPFIK
jgi:thiol-disulfide isomerase/thioredoxin